MPTRKSSAWTEQAPGFSRVFDWGADRSVMFRGVQYPAVHVQAPELGRGDGADIVFLGYHSDTLVSVHGARQFMQLVTGQDLGVPALTVSPRWFAGDTKLFDQALRQVQGAQARRR